MSGSLFKSRRTSLAATIAAVLVLSIVFRHSVHKAANIPTAWKQPVDKDCANHETSNALVLTGICNPWGSMGEVLAGPAITRAYNPTILPLGRIPDVEFLIMSRNGSTEADAPSGSAEIWRHYDVIWYLAQYDFKRPLLKPALIPSIDPQLLQLQDKRSLVSSGCGNSKKRHYFGEEDPRLVWTPTGQPILVFVARSCLPDRCQGIHVVDVRKVVPTLAGMMPINENSMHFQEVTEYHREAGTVTEKNWAIFFIPEITRDGTFALEHFTTYFMVDFVGPRVYRLPMANGNIKPGLVLPVPGSVVDPAAKKLDCLASHVPRGALHYAAPPLRLTLCLRGQCQPTIHNTLLVGFIHAKIYQPLYYDKRVVTWNTTQPFHYHSVSRPMVFLGVDHKRFSFVTSLAFQHSNAKYQQHINRTTSSTPHQTDLGHGFLDDIVIVSFGIHDEWGGFVDVYASDLMRSHHSCIDQ